MKLPPFFDEVPRLRLHDPLAEVLGCAEGGELEYTYADAVRLTGHSCPTVAAAYWLTCRALHALYPDSLPERGGVKVEFRDDARVGSNGVVANVVQMLTGAAGGSGFKGLGGHHGRAGLMRYAPGLPLSLRFTRLDNRAAVDAAADLTLPATDPALDALIERSSHGMADATALRELGRLWQQRVRRLLIDHADDPGVFVIREVRHAMAAPTMVKANRRMAPAFSVAPTARA
jgi:hypothetical protein